MCFLGLERGRMDYKDTEPKMSAFLSNLPVNGLCGMCLTDFIDWRYIHSWLVFSTSLWTVAPIDEGTCVLLPLYLLSDLPPLYPASQSKHTIYTGSVWLGGGGVLSCVVDHILQEFNTLFLTRFRTYKIAPPPHPKMTSVRCGPDRIELLGKPPASSAFLPSRASSRKPAFLRSPHANAGMKQKKYKCGRTQPLLHVGHDHEKLAVET